MQSLAATTAGRVEGRVENGLHVFRGIPFAEPPVGSLRFKPPQPRQPWTRRARRHPLRTLGAPGPERVAREWLGLDGEASEDCLSLNVWTPGLDGTQAPGDGVDPRRRVRRRRLEPSDHRGRDPGAARRRGGGDGQLPARRARLPRARRDRRRGVRALRQRRAARSDPRARVGARQRRRVRRRSGERDDLRRVGRRDQRERAARAAARAPAVPQGDRAERRGVDRAPARSLARAGARVHAARRRAPRSPTSSACPLPIW